MLMRVHWPTTPQFQEEQKNCSRKGKPQFMQTKIMEVLFKKCYSFAIGSRGRFWGLRTSLLYNSGLGRSSVLDTVFLVESLGLSSHVQWYCLWGNNQGNCSPGVTCLHDLTGTWSDMQSSLSSEHWSVAPDAVPLSKIILNMVLTKKKKYPEPKWFMPFVIWRCIFAHG